MNLLIMLQTINTQMRLDHLHENSSGLTFYHQL